MLETMYVRCTHCGYDNSPEYRFCGMCGGSLAHPVTQTKPPLRDVTPPAVADSMPASAPSSAPSPVPPSQQFRAEPARPVLSGDENVHGPSFLGLSEDPKIEFNYLYEDEPTRSHAGLIVVLILLLGAGGFLAWQWRHNGYPFNRMTASNTQSAPAPAPSPDQSQSQPAAASKAGDQTATGADNVIPTAPEQKAPANDAGNPPQPAAQENAGSAPTAASPPAKTENAEAAPPARAKPAKMQSAKAAAKPREVEPASLTSAPDADLELAGERYLYGSGLPQNCARAESSLRTAATHGNSKAETVLGTMYATGHCVGRDLPAAYRWFARALHEEPQNSRISADLQVLWRQMTPQEKQLATTSRQ